MFDFLHSILKWQFLNRIQIYRIFYHQLRDRNLLTLLERAGERAQRSARRSCTIKRTALQCCADKCSVRFVREVSAYKSSEGVIQIINK